MTKKKAKYDDSDALFEAVKSAQNSRRYGALKQLLAEGLNPDSSFANDHRRTLLFQYYLKEGAAKILLDAGANASYVDENGYTPLHSANPEVAALLLRQGVDIESRNNSGRVTPLLAQAIRGDARMVKLLLHNGADVLASYDNHRRGVIEAAASSGEDGGRFRGRDEIFRLVETHVGRGLVKGTYTLKSLRDISGGPEAQQKGEFDEV
ncbi:ankyrin repeat domain-containing protein [Arenimonas sp. MALMAid1274]|uniref:ankyrin repeat domain-containing protein n=1 Tax=Arenimonas sp. MALMAid1274 TaxID=3411630 RepID=UPI003B9EFBFC